MKRNNKRKSSAMLIYVLLGFVTFMVAGYALFSQNISVTGTASADANFSIVWQNVALKAGSTCTGGTVTPTLSGGNTILTINPTLSYPGACVEVQADVYNAGNVPAKVTNVTTTNPVGPDIDITYTPTFAIDQTLAAGASTTVVVKVAFDAASTNQAAISETFGVVVEYSQNT